VTTQYIRANREKRELQFGEYAWLKYVSGKIEPAKFPAASKNTSSRTFTPSSSDAISSPNHSNGPASGS